jgi:hypothetical protein
MFNNFNFGKQLQGGFERVDTKKLFYYLSAGKTCQKNYFNIAWQLTHWWK